MFFRLLPHFRQYCSPQLLLSQFQTHQLHELSVVGISLCRLY